MGKIVTILGLDPGEKNYGYTVLQVQAGTKVQFNIKTLGQLENPPKEIQIPYFDRFVDEVRTVITDNNVTTLCLERYINRGRFKGALGEKIAVTYGLLYHLSKELELGVYFCMASAWKVRFGAQKLKNFYQIGKKLGISEHSIDSLVIGLYGVGMHQNQKITFPSMVYLTKKLRKFKDS